MQSPSGGSPGVTNFEAMHFAKPSQGRTAVTRYSAKGQREFRAARFIDVGCSQRSIALSAPAAAQTASDSTFLDTDWSLMQFTTPTGGTSTGGQVLAGGNPGSFREITDALNGAGPGLNRRRSQHQHLHPVSPTTRAVSGAIASLSILGGRSVYVGLFRSGPIDWARRFSRVPIFMFSPAALITGPSLRLDQPRFEWVGRGELRLGKRGHGRIDLLRQYAASGLFRRRRGDPVRLLPREWDQLRRRRLYARRRHRQLADNDQLRSAASSGRFDAGPDAHRVGACGAGSAASR